MALVITLILLAVITFMAITFLVVSRSHHNMVAAQTEAQIARDGSESGLAAAEADIIVPFLSFSNVAAGGFFVSTNYINPLGFTGSPGSTVYTNATNVSYTYPNGAPLNNQDLLQNLQNLKYRPRVPVFMTNRTAKTMESRYYYDINRNSTFDQTGLQPVISRDPNYPYYDTNGNPISAIIPGNTMSNFMVGDPQWVGGFERPGFPHSPTNRAIWRYCYFVVPISETLDLNYVHNYAKFYSVPGDAAMPPGAGDGFLRDQGVSTHEINLASFLVDLNTNYWQTPNLISNYAYRWFNLNPPNPAPANTGVAFYDATSLLRYRYAGNLTNLLSIRAMFGVNGANTYGGDFVDSLQSGPPMTNDWWTKDFDTPLQTKSPCAYSDNPNHFFTTQDLFDRTKTGYGLGAAATTFSDRLSQACAQSNTYDRSTFTRLMSSMGTDSTSEKPKLNLNFVNVDTNTGTIIPSLITNFTQWTPVQFFTNAAIRMLGNAGFTVGSVVNYQVGLVPTNILVADGNGATHIQIQIYPTNFYTPSVHRYFQLAANIYDGSTSNRVTELGLPSVFQPLFSTPDGGKHVYITGYKEVTDVSVPVSPAALAGVPGGILDLYDAAQRSAIKPGANVMFSGIPIIIGAKKGYPNFNEFAMNTQVSVTRKLDFFRPVVTANFTPMSTNVMYQVGISNSFGLEAWNSYPTNFQRDLKLVVSIDMSTVMSQTNDSTGIGSIIFSNTYPVQNSSQPLILVTNIAKGTWDRFADINHPGHSLRVDIRPTDYHFNSLTNSSYAGNSFQIPVGYFSTNQFWPLPHWRVNVHRRVRFMLVDTAANRIVDYVNLDSNLSPDAAPVDITDALTRNAWNEAGACANVFNYSIDKTAFWCTNRGTGIPPGNVSAPTFGIRDQLTAIFGGTPAPDWQSLVSPAPGTTGPSLYLIRYNLAGPPGVPSGVSENLYYTNAIQAAYNPTRNIFIKTKWQANDPLVHYVIGDLTDTHESNPYDLENPKLATINIGSVNERYEPWDPRGTTPRGAASLTKAMFTVKDPLLTRTADYEFPTNKLPNIGWLGRIHRGTPFQTVYFKADDFTHPLDVNTWSNWTGNKLWVTNYGQLSTALVPITNGYLDLLLSRPTNDWALLDLFTAAYNENATRGQMSINQTNLAAWSAILGGVLAVTNTLGNSDLGSPAYFPSGQFAPVEVSPAGFYNAFGPKASQPPLVRICNAINDVRATNSGGAFTKFGDILRVPELTVASPFLNLSDAQRSFGITDEAYERLPQQVAGLLKLDTTPRYVIYSIGQALKPADRSIVTSGPYFNLCTNYQVMAEVAVRAVVRIEGLTDNPRRPHVVIERYNVLPPD